MAFFCPECRTCHLGITASIFLPSDSRSDDIVLQLVKCETCAFQAVAIYEESRRGALNSESSDHTGYYVSEDAWKNLHHQIATCPQPDNTSCQCAAHSSLGNQDQQGRWVGLNAIETKNFFPMEYISG
jgi:hypothetical protein